MTDLELLNLVLESLRRPRRAERLALAQGFSLSELSGAAQAFVDGGVRALSERASRPQWLCWGVHLRHGDSAELWAPRSKARRLPRARFLRSFRRTLSDWLAGPEVRGLYFMHKPPGMRLRVETTRPGHARSLVERWLDRQSEVKDVRPMAYDPETHQFGGPRGLQIAHAHFTADSLAALDVGERYLSGTARTGLEFLSVLCIMDLLKRVAEDRWELWDLWRGLELTGRLVELPASVTEAFAADLRPVIDEPAAAVASLSAAERRTFRAYATANVAAARALRRAAAAGELLYPPRKILPFWVVFHWNRWSFPMKLQMCLAGAIERLLDPKGAS
jgi:thiopeptide-type bacteriocin biosynthesis protein